MFSDVQLDKEQTQNYYGYSPDDLHLGSHRKVVVKCLNCGKLTHREYRNQHRVHQCAVVDGTQKRCFGCQEWKDLSMFSKNPTTSGGVAKLCRSCFNSNPSVINLETRRKARLRRAVQNNDIEFYINFRKNCIKSIAKRKGIPFDLDKDYLFDMWEQQLGNCYYSGIPMIGSMKQEGFQNWDSPSIDRKEPYLGYTKGNVVWCIFGVNSFKQSLNEQQFSEVIGKISWWNRESPKKDEPE